MISEQAYFYGSQPSVIRALFEHGRQRAKIVGKEAVCDFSLGNPSVPTPQAVTDALLTLLKTDSLSAHGYTSSAGCDELRTALADSLTRRFKMKVYPENLFISCGAAAALTGCFAALTLDNETEFVAIAPYFPEYRAYSETMGAHLQVIPADEEHFQINFAALEAVINVHTQGVIINSPNNPSGVVYTADTLKKLGELLRLKSAEMGHPIYLISDEPYRELVYDGVQVPFVPDFYEDSVVCYSWSKCLSLPGDRIGYALVPEQAADSRKLLTAIVGACRRLGYVCAPSMIQKAVASCVDVMPDLTVYARNRAILMDALPRMGYDCAKPDGAFYLFIRAPKGNGQSFSEAAKAKDLLLVPAAGFGAPNHVRLAYCVDTAVVERSLPIFEELIAGA